MSKKFFTILSSVTILAFIVACGAAPETITVVETVEVEVEKEVVVVETVEVEVEKEVIKEVEVETIVEVTAVPEEMPEPILIGFTSDASGQYANSGSMDRKGMMMAIAEFDGTVLGRPIEIVHYDTETTPATGTRVAERMINQDGVSFMIGAVSSGVANAISQVAQKNGVVYLNTNSSSPWFSTYRRMCIEH